MAKIVVIDIATRWAHNFRRDEYEKQDQARREKALRYLKCEGDIWSVPEAVKGKDSCPVVKVSQSPMGYSYLEVRWRSGIACACKYEGWLSQMYKRSGMKKCCASMTFGKYKFVRTSPGTLRAKRAAKNLCCR